MSHQHPAPVNDRLRLARVQRHWSQEELAELVGTTRVNVSRWEHHVTTPGPYFRQKLCEVFQMTAEALGLLVTDTQKVALPDTAPQPPAAFWHLPYRRNPFFLGRDDILEQIYTTLHSTGGTPAIPQALCGLGGIGKTQIALEYAYRHRDEYPIVLWISAETSSGILNDYMAIAVLAHLVPADEKEQDRIVAAIKQWLETYRHWLVIFDNNDDSSILAEFLPQNPQGHILLTTRSQATGLTAGNIDVGPLPTDEGVLYLFRRAKLLPTTGALSDISAQQRMLANVIYTTVGGLPLALDQAGAYIEETGCSLADYLGRFQHQQMTLLGRRGESAGYHPQPVSVTVSLSHERVRHGDTLAATLLYICSFLQPDAIPEEMLIEGSAELEPPLTSLFHDPLRYDAAIAILRKYSLVHRHAESHDLSIHRLVQVVLQASLDNADRHIWAERVVRMVNRVFPESEMLVTRSQCEPFLPHALICANLIDQWQITSDSAGRLLTKASAYLEEYGQLTQAITLLRQALNIYERRHELNHPDAAQTLVELGTDLFRLGNFTEGESTLKQALDIYEQEPDLHQKDTAAALTSLSMLYQVQGRQAEAEALSRRSLDISERLFPGDHVIKAEALSSLAMVYMRQNRPAEAETLFLRALPIYERTVGVNHAYYAACLNNIAFLYRHLRRYDESEQFTRQVIAILEQSVGYEHPNMAITLDNLAKICALRGQYDEAEEYHQQALAIFERTLGPEHPDVGICLNNLVKLYEIMGREDEAMPLRHKAELIQRKAR
jgi:tetratricopeptide (TPR) repeat protein/transcriptional regulator with XRE-family HTH domain